MMFSNRIKMGLLYRLWNYIQTKASFLNFQQIFCSNCLSLSGTLDGLVRYSFLILTTNHQSVARFLSLHQYQDPYSKVSSEKWTYCVLVLLLTSEAVDFVYLLFIMCEFVFKSRTFT